MNTKRSYLDALNAGRQRRSSSSLDQITQSLQNLEDRLDRSRDDDPWRTQHYPANQYGEPRHAPRADYGYGGRYGESERHMPPPRSAPMPRPAPLPRSAPRAPAPEPSYQSIARDFDRMRGQEESVASASKIASELQGLREDLRQQMTTGLQREFDSLKQELARVTSSPASIGSELSNEIERISHAMHGLSERSDDKAVSMLRMEIDQVKRALETLAREETVLSVDRRWDEFDRRWSAFEHRVDARQNTPDPAIDVLSERLKSIGEAVQSLPESLSLRSLEDKIRTLATAVDHFVRQQEQQAPETFALIEERLDEISRAIVASSAAAQMPNFDPEPFHRIEARISALAQQIEEVAEDRPTAAVIDHLHLLTRRVDELAAKGAVPDRAVERLTGQIAMIAQKIDNAPTAPPADILFQGIDQRFELLSAMMDRRQGDAVEQNNAVFRDLEHRLEELAERIDRRAADPLENGEVLAAIDARFSAIADRFNSANHAAEDNSQAIRGLEGRLESISRRIDTSSKQLAGIDASLIRSLESQVSALSEHLSRPMSPVPEIEDIGPRLNDLERSIAGSRDSILEAARQAAETAVRALGSSQDHTAAVSDLAQEMRALEALTRRTDQRTAKTFDAIHDTLIKIVDRLGTLDAAEAADTGATRRRATQDQLQASVSKLAIADVPPIAPDSPPRRGRTEAEPPVQFEFSDAVRALRSRTPAEAAAEAALAAVGSERIADADEPARSKSLFGGLARAFSSRKTTAQPAPDSAVEPAMAEETASLDLDSPLDPAAVNRPLEPGSGAPDLNAIMKRVRDERGYPGKPSEPDSASSDFIAAARRAAQAAAAEAEALKRNADVSGQVRAFRLGESVKSRRKPILMAATAILVVLAGLQLGKAFFGQGEQIAEMSTSDAVVIDDDAATMPPLAGAAGPSMAGAPVEDASPVEPAANVRVAEPVPSLDDQPMPEAPSVRQAEAAAPADPATAPDQPAATAAATAPVIASVPVEAGPVPLREAAEAGDAKALFEVGSRYADGRGVTADMKQAAKWYEKSAELGFAPAQFRIGNYYEKGLGVERDLAKSRTWYQLAAAQGNVSAMHNLAVLFAMGADGTADNESAVRWFTSAADRGVRDSQFNLGILAAKGVGMPQSLEESYKWFAIVAKSGDRDAAAKRDEIANSLRPEQLQSARATVELWKPKAIETEANEVEIPESWQESAGTTASIDMKKAIGNIQRILNKNGYEAGTADGVMGQKTKDAIIAFQKDNDLPPTGTIDEDLVRALIAKK